MAYIEDKVTDIIVDKLNINEREISRDSKLTDLGADSLDSVEVIMEIEREFDFRIPDEDAEKMLTVGEMIDYIAEKNPKYK